MVPVVPGLDGAIRALDGPDKDGPKCVACGIRGGVNKHLFAAGLDTLVVCVDYHACADRTRADDLAMMALDRMAS